MASESTKLDTQQADRQRVPDDLKNRCAEILGWQKTGVLTGNALREFAKQKYGDDPHALQQAASETAREAYRVITAAPEAPAQACAVDERAAFEAWAKSPPRGQTPLWREGDGYVYWQTEWEAWQARAALAQKGGQA